MDSLSASLEPTFQSLGLASWWPSGRMQYFMETLHTCSLELPWWATIMATTCLIRLCVFPLVVSAQRNAAGFANHAPGMQRLQEKMTEARKRGDQMESAQLGMELKKYMNKHNINPLKNAFPLLVQAPIFVSMFVGLRGMANLPVESLASGGLFWFTDLTMKDPYYLLPAMTATTTFLQFKWAADGGVQLDQAGPIMRGVLKAMPVAIFFLTMNFPAAVTFYWFNTNLISVTQAQIVRRPKIRDALGIPQLVKHHVDGKMPKKKKGFREGVREAVDNWKVQADIVDRRVHDERIFREAGSMQRRTYKFDPTNPRIPSKKKVT